MNKYFQENYNELYNLAYCVASKKLKNEYDAEEVASESLCTLLLKIKEGTEINNVNSYLWKITQNNIFKRIKIITKSNHITKELIENDDTKYGDEYKILQTLDISNLKSEDILSENEFDFLNYIIDSHFDYNLVADEYKIKTTSLRKRLSSIISKIESYRLKRAGIIVSKKLLSLNQRDNLFRFLNEFKKNIENNSLEKMTKYFTKETLHNYNPSFDIGKVVYYKVKCINNIFKVRVGYKKKINNEVAFFTFSFSFSQQRVIITVPPSPIKIAVKLDKLSKQRLSGVDRNVEIGSDGKKKWSPEAQNIINSEGERLFLKQINQYKKDFKLYLKTAKKRRLKKSGNVKTITDESGGEIILDISDAFYKDSQDITKPQSKKLIVSRMIDDAFEQDCDLIRNEYFKELLNISDATINRIFKGLCEYNGVSNKKFLKKKLKEERNYIITAFLSGKELDQLYKLPPNEIYKSLNTLYHFAIVVSFVEKGKSAKRIQSKIQCGERYVSELTGLYNDIKDRYYMHRMRTLNELFDI